MTKQLLVVGVNQAGKTSVIRALADTSEHHTSFGSDFATRELGQCIVERNNVKYHCTEAPGVAEAVKNHMDEDHKLAHLEQLTLLASHPIDLLLFVSRSGTIHNNTKDMYTLINNVMPKNIPMIGVITGCENESDMNQWARTNRPHFERHGIMFDEMVGTCFGRGGRMESVFVELRQESARDLWAIIDQTFRSHPIQTKRNAKTQAGEKDNRKTSSGHGALNAEITPPKKPSVKCLTLTSFWSSFRGT